MIHIYCGKSQENWTPENLKKGLGGSEQAVIHISKELIKYDKVTVWNQSKGGVFDGVIYKPYEEVKINDGDILIIWRKPKEILQFKNIKCQKYLWLHDMVAEKEVIPYQYLYDKIFVLSEFHRKSYKNIEDDRFYITRNGINDKKLHLKRQLYKMVFCSSYNRGLNILLENWTKIKLEVPDAELYVMYGWQTLKNIYDKPNFDLVHEYFEHLFNQEGVHHLGRVSQEEVCKHLATADIFAYPCIYPETSCIVAMQAQNQGAIPVYLPNGALKETIKKGVKPKFDFTKPMSNEIVENAYIDTLIKTLKLSKEEKDKLRSTDYLNTCKEIAREWNDLFVKN